MMVLADFCLKSLQTKTWPNVWNGREREPPLKLIFSSNPIQVRTTCFPKKGINENLTFGT